MIINDRIYGKVRIDSPVLIELIKSKPLQRLKKIAQYGIPDEFYYRPGFSRYEHSIGVMLLLKQLGAPEKEQIAGLLHDVSHTAFSHLIDWVLGKGGGKEDFQDNNHKRFINSKNISSILKKYEYYPKEIADYAIFGLLEKPLPNLCADRADYSLREFSKVVAIRCYNNITVVKNQMVFKDKKIAFLYAKNFLYKQETHWGGFEANARYKMFGSLLNYALNKKIIKFKDFWEYDVFIVKKLRKSKDKKILKGLSLLRQKSWKKFPKSNIRQTRKFRRVDPLFLEKNKLIRLSRIDKKFSKLLKDAEERNKKGTVLPLMEEFI